MCSLSIHYEALSVQVHLHRHVRGYDKGHGLALTSQMAPQESGSEVKAMARGYFIAHWDQLI